MSRSMRPAEFELKVHEALEDVRKVLDTTRSPAYPKDVAHQYGDKYNLAELGVKASVAALVNILEASTAWQANLAAMRAWVKENKAVSLRFTATEECTFENTATREVESPTAVVKEATSSLFGSSKSATKTVTTITEHFWNLAAKWELAAFTGASPADGTRIVLTAGTGNVAMKTTGNTPVAPRPASATTTPGSDLDITWLISRFQDSDGGSVLEFTIDRTDKQCHTPSRNTDVAEALKFFEGLAGFTQGVVRYQRDKLFGLQARFQTDRKLPTNEIVQQTLFPMVHAMFALEEEGDTSDNSAAATLTLSPRDFACFVAEHQGSLKELAAKMGKDFPSTDEGGLLTVDSAMFCACMHQASLLSATISGLVSTLEAMLRDQLTAAIGKNVGADDFAEYMEFHNRKLFRSQVAPKPFCHSIRRPNRFPEGTLSIEVGGKGGSSKPITTATVQREAQHPMKFPLSAAANVEFMGNRYVHAAMLYSFSGQQNVSQLQLIARARQFSSFVLLVGKIVSADVFEPTAAMIVKNRDDLKIPLMLEAVPTAKEFKDAISSMSPEQQRFAQAFRSMQLASTLFGCVVIQIKPQMEKLLNLADGALTKEIKLTEDLMSLFIEYQIPADLVSYEGASDEGGATKLEQVKGHVAQVQSVIAEAREAEIKAAAEVALKEKLRQAEFAQAPPSTAWSSRSAPPPMGGGVPVIMRQSVRQDDCVTDFVRPWCDIPPPMARSGASRRSKKNPTPLIPVEQHFQHVQPTMSSPRQAPEPEYCAVQARAGDDVDRAYDRFDVAPVPQQHTQQNQPGGGTTDLGEATAEIDYTTLPQTLDKQFETHDPDSAVRATILSLGEGWSRSRADGLLSKPRTTWLAQAEQKTEKSHALDLLDALTRSGALQIDCADLHVILAATHCFDDTLVETVIQKNTNPIESVERTTLAMASTVHGVPARELVASAELQRVATYSPALMQ